MTASTATDAAVVEHLLTEAAPPCQWVTNLAPSSVCPDPAEWVLRIEYDCARDNQAITFLYCTSHKDRFVEGKVFIHNAGCGGLHPCSVIYLGRI